MNRVQSSESLGSWNTFAYNSSPEWCLIDLHNFMKLSEVVRRERQA